MKQKVNTSSPVTEDRLKDILKESEERLEEKLDKKFAERLEASQKAFRMEMRYEYSVMKEDISRDMSKFTNLILTAIDPLLKELETRQQDREIGTAQIKNIKGDVENLKKRVTKLEHS